MLWGFQLIWILVDAVALLLSAFLASGKESVVSRKEKFEEGEEGAGDEGGREAAVCIVILVIV